MSIEDVTPTELVTGIYKGDKQSEALLVQKYSRPLLYILVKRCGDRELARDISQETFMILLEKFRKQMINDPEKLAAYIQQTALNILIANKRKESRRQTYPDTEFVDTCMDEVSSPLNEVQRMSIRKMVRDSILSLSNSRDKEILYSYYVHELDKDEICKHLDIDFRHFDKVISRARSRLKDAMKMAGKDDAREVTG